MLSRTRNGLENMAIKIKTKIKIVCANRKPKYFKNRKESSTQFGMILRNLLTNFAKYIKHTHTFMHIYLFIYNQFRSHHNITWRITEDENPIV